MAFVNSSVAFTFFGSEGGFSGTRYLGFLHFVVWGIFWKVLAFKAMFWRKGCVRVQMMLKCVGIFGFLFKEDMGFLT